jgi:hypothetical protein
VSGPAAVGTGPVRRLLVTANVVPSSPIIVTLMMVALSSSETSVLTRARRHNISEDGILQECGSLTSKPKYSSIHFILFFSLTVLRRHAVA